VPEMEGTRSLTRGQAYLRYVEERQDRPRRRPEYLRPRSRQRVADAGQNPYKLFRGARDAPRRTVVEAQRTLMAEIPAVEALLELKLMALSE